MLAAVGLAVGLAANEPVSWVVAALLPALALGVVVLRKWPALTNRTQLGLFGTYVSVRAVLAVAVGAGYLARRPDDRWWICAAMATALIATLVEPAVKSVLAVDAQKVANLSGVARMPSEPFPAGWLTSLSLATLVLGALLAAVAAPGWLFLLLALPAVPALGITVLYALRAHAAAARIQRELSPALIRYAPAFALYYASEQGVQYQVGMWLPYLERLNRPFVVITRHPSTVDTIAAMTSAPVLSPRRKDLLPSLEEFVVPSLKAAFYVQGSSANETFQRNRGLTHVWLNHGDSDKQANYDPRHATYDKLFVSGQLGRDRYANHGIAVPADRFVLVGRPQIEAIEVRDTPLPPGAPRTVLYAPTWRGGRRSTNYSSLPVGEPIVAALLERGITVLFRPHPLTWSQTEDADRARRIQKILAADAAASGRRHAWGRQAERDWDLPDCFNASAALVTDVSSVATDYLASGKPLAMVATDLSVEGFRQAFALARVAYVIDPELDNLSEVIDQLCGTDPLRAERLAYRSYCLGDQLGPHAAERFLLEAGRIIDGDR